MIGDITWVEEKDEAKKKHDNLVKNGKQIKMFINSFQFHSQVFKYVSNKPHRADRGDILNNSFQILKSNLNVLISKPDILNFLLTYIKLETRKLMFLVKVTWRENIMLTCLTEHILEKRNWSV